MRKFFILSALALGGLLAGSSSSEAAYNHRGSNNYGVCQPRFNRGNYNSGHRHSNFRWSAWFNNRNGRSQHRH